MPTATKEKTETEKPAEKVRFESKCSNLVLTRRQERTVDDGFGGKKVLTESQWAAEMQERGEDYDDTPWKVEFQNGQFRTDHPKQIAWLRQHKQFGVNTPTGFYEVQPAPDELRPTMAEQSKRIAQVSAALDYDGLQEILEQERSTHNRPEVIEAADAAMQVIAEGPSESEAVAETPGNGDSDGPDRTHGAAQ